MTLRSEQSRSIMLPIYAAILVIALLVIGIQVFGINMANPFAKEQIATTEAIDFWASDGARLDTGGRDIIEQTAFQGGRALDGCVLNLTPVDCQASADALRSLEERLRALIVEAEALVPTAATAADPSISGWIEAQIAAWREDLSAIGLLAGVAATGYDRLAWENAVTDFNENERREDAEEALRTMLPNREIMTVDGVTLQN